MPGPAEPEELVALATELEKEGQYNAAKLLRAAVAAVINRAAFNRTAPKSAAAQAERLEELAGLLVGSHLQDLSGPLRRAAGALRANRVALVDEAPDPYVCRICGELTCVPFANRCQYCGRWPNTAERVRPIYWLRESDRVEAVNRLQETTIEVARLIGDGSDPGLLQPAPDGGWSAHQVLEHLQNAQVVFRGRIDQLVAGGDPELTSVMVWEIKGADTTTSDLMLAYTELRSEIVERLSSAPPEVWQHTGRHEEWGRVTLAEQVSYFANHEPTHLAQLADAVHRPPSTT